MKKRVVLFSVLTILLIVLVVANICIGSIRVPFSDVLKVITGQGQNLNSYKIIAMIRVPRTLAALLLGGGLALSGYMLQTFFHNPIAGPFVLGISSGAKLLVAILMVTSVQIGFYMNSVLMIIAALIGSIIVTFFVLVVSTKVKQMSILIVCGVMVGYICSAITELIISLADDANIVNLHNWSLGTFSGTDWQDIMYIFPIITASVLISILLSKKMEGYSFGEEYAISLGIHVKVFRVCLILLSSILSATVTAFAGPVSFVGIAVPHVMRELFKTDKPIVIIPASFIGGAVFCLFSDLLARMVVAPAELSISTMTAIFGAPVVITMLIKRKRR